MLIGFLHQCGSSPFGNLTHNSGSVIGITFVNPDIDLSAKTPFNLVDSIAFAIPKGSEITSDWRQGIKETRLTYRFSSYNSGSGYYDSSGSDYGTYTSVSETANIDLCTDNTFAYYSSNQSSFDSAGGFGSGAYWYLNRSAQHYS